MNRAALFFLVTGAAVVSIVAMWLTLGRVAPWRWTLWDIAYLIPILACAMTSILAGSALGYRSRALSGFLQAVAFLCVFSDASIELRDPVEVTTSWTVWVVLYASLFTLLPHGAGAFVARRRLRQLGSPRCKKCGYSLYGLTEPRCPECGQSFCPSLLEATAPGAVVEAGKREAEV